MYGVFFSKKCLNIANHEHRPLGYAFSSEPLRLRIAISGSV
jgi:hypothetical protein